MVDMVIVDLFQGRNSSMLRTYKNIYIAQHLGIATWNELSGTELSNKQRRSQAHALHRKSKEKVFRTPFLPLSIQRDKLCGIIYFAMVVVFVVVVVVVVSWYVWSELVKIYNRFQRLWYIHIIFWFDIHRLWKQFNGHALTRNSRSVHTNNMTTHGGTMW